MGFFSDLKEDLSTSVNDFMPSEDEVTEEAAVAEAPAEEIKVQQDVSGELESLLDKMDEAPAPEPASQKPAPSFVGKIASDETALVTAGMSIKGNITSDGSLDVIGSIEGNIDILGKLNVTGAILGDSKAMEVYAENAKITGEIKSEGSVKIGQSTVVIGNIFATSAVVAGAVKGDIDVHGPVILDTSAIVMGNIKSKSVQINNGAVIEGMCSQCYAEVNPTSFFDGIKQKGKNK